MKSIPVLPALLWATCCLAAPGSGACSATDSAAALLPGRYDNREQAAMTAGSADGPVPHVTISIEPTPQKDFALWHVHLETDAESSFAQTWAMQARNERDGSGALIPYYQLYQDTAPDAGAFDPQGWLSLEACALRGAFGKSRFAGISEGEPCVAVSMSVGARRALLPVGFTREGDVLRLEMNLRGVRTRIDAKRVR